MRTTTKTRTTLAVLGSALALGVAAAPAQAAPADKPQVLSSFNQRSADPARTSHRYACHADATKSAALRDHPLPTLDVRDLTACTPGAVADQSPLAFVVQACARHDFGYRNYKAAGQFDANKSRLDSAFYEDMKRVCTGYTGEKNTACNSTAWTYYQAVKIFG
ncbi:phospholipase A2 [Streptomyces sp. DHE17-7]|uniref:phospholipase A2 n=1 Tax=Streptomyces sp. DHE17-7 TaxID=2759949 RepID=UPI0022EA5100|nr:phospholipase A2 [Streptomyces sp. DHE17-7]MBJ6622121.1 hypothetical protein [Streptomyces sp. DHE17-7]